MGRKNTLTKRVKSLERHSRPEIKFRTDESGAFDTIGSVNGTLIRPQELAQTTGRAGRIGDKVKTRNIRFQAIIKMPTDASNCTCAVRFLVLRSKESEPITGDMPNWYGSVNQDKFFIIKDILTQVSILGHSEEDVTCGSTVKKIKLNIPTGLRKLQYADTISPINNEYFIYILAENQSAEIAYNWQHFYLDN